MGEALKSLVGRYMGDCPEGKRIFGGCPAFHYHKIPVTRIFGSSDTWEGEKRKHNPPVFPSSLAKTIFTSSPTHKGCWLDSNFEDESMDNSRMTDVVKEQNVNVIDFDNMKVKIKLAEAGTLKGVGRNGDRKDRKQNDILTLGLPWQSSGQDSKLPVQGTQVRSLVRELGSHMPHVAKTQKIK